MKETVVLKFGGAAVSTPESFAKIADIIIQRKKEFTKVAVVISAMGDTTDDLTALAKKVHPSPPRREYDMLVTVGERISIALLAMALSLKDIEAKSFTGSQSGIITCTEHSDAKIVDVRPHRVVKSLDEGKVAIIAGFQGVSTEGEITTLGRGGSDTSAVAMAIALNATCVEFYKDVGGIFTSDPKKDTHAKKIASLTFDEAQMIIDRGAEVLHRRSLLLAKNNGLPLKILSFCDVQTGLEVGSVISDVSVLRTTSPVFEGSCVSIHT